MTDDLDRIGEALSFISADGDRLTLVRMRMAIKIRCRGDAEFDAFIAWSKTGASKYNKKVALTDGRRPSRSRSPLARCSIKPRRTAGGRGQTAVH